ncbi:MAG: TIGR02678 family protein [Pseudonocardiaceae bacterium]|nr:TIGR02678 family protein [Pseudonocardiaceae bacterium]
MSSLANQLAIAERHDVARGIRLLLADPLITERGAPESFELIRRRKDPIARWFDYYCGWSVTVEPRLGYARLAKVRTDVDATRPAHRLRSGRAAFDRRRYTLLCVVAAELLTAPVTTIGLLADRIARATAADPVVGTFDTAHKPERRAYVDALRLLESYGAIEVVDGSTESFVDAEDAKVLYRVDATSLMRMLSAPTGPSRLAVPIEDVPGRFDELLGEITREPRYGTRAGGEGGSEVQRNLWLRHSVFRRLFDDPVVYRDDLCEAQLAYLTSPTGRQLARKAADEAGFVVEERAEGWLLTDTDALATDGKFPDDSSNAKVAALLLLDVIAASTGGVTPEQLRSEADTLLTRFPRWARTYRTDDGPDPLVADAITVLTEFGLARHSGDRIRALPAAARYAVTATRTTEDVSGTPGGIPS